jgi:PPOX class probable F420-dependent enzyme
MATIDDAARDAFLGETRLGVLSTIGDDGSPIAVPIWFEWDGKYARMFTSVTSPKVRRIERDPRASLLVARPLGEPEAWIAIDGRIEILDEGGIELAERLAARYWDLTDPERRETLELWRKASQVLRVLELVPTGIRTYQD